MARLSRSIAQQRLQRHLSLLRKQLPLLQTRFHVRSLGVFGSYVHGTAKSTSDLDLLVEFVETPSLFQFMELEHYLSGLLHVKVDLVMKDTLKPLIGRRILHDVVGL